jgi:hypothetical protein
MKIIKAKVAGNDTLYIIKRVGLFSRKSEIYWISQNMALPVINIGAVQDNYSPGGDYEPEEEYDPEKAQERADEKRDEMREDGIPVDKN